MESARSAVETLEVTQAVRDSVVDGQEVREGQFMALLDNRLAALAGTPDEALRTGLQHSDVNDDSIITLYWGEGTAAEQAARLQEELEETYQGAQVDVYEGGQPHYPYLVSVE
jgi:dihydroxyacetone kinase-like predicted kinase